MGHHVRVRGVEREFDPQRYAHLVIALAKELASRNEQPPPTRRRRKSAPPGETQ